VRVRILIGHPNSHEFGYGKCGRRCGGRFGCSTGAGRSHHHHPFLSRPKATHGLRSNYFSAPLGLQSLKKKGESIFSAVFGRRTKHLGPTSTTPAVSPGDVRSCARAEAPVMAAWRKFTLSGERSGGRKTIDRECSQGRNPIFVGPAFLIRTRLSFATLDQDDERFPNCAEVTRGRRSNLTSVSSSRAWPALSSPPALAWPPAFS
jgi:hypothetical protein